MTVPRQQSPPPSLESIPKAVVGFRRTLFADETRREFRPHVSFDHENRKTGRFVQRRCIRL